MPQQAQPVQPVQKVLLRSLIKIISETNGISLADTLDLLLQSDLKKENAEAFAVASDFSKKLSLFSQDELKIQELLKHPMAQPLFEFFKNFPLTYREEHIHLTGALNAKFVWPRLQKLIQGPNQEIYRQKITEVYGPTAWPIQSEADVDRLIRLTDGEGFSRYLKILYLPKLLLVDRQAHAECSYHMAEEMFSKYNVGLLRLKFTLSRASSSSSDQIPGAESVTSEDAVLGILDGFLEFKKKHPNFNFVLSPSFRKESNFFDATKYKTRKAHFEAQVDEIVRLIDKHPKLAEHMTEVDTVGNENELYRKEHFNEFRKGLRKLQYRGFKIRSHHGETFNTLKKGIQAVDNAMNIWHIDTLEHGLSLGINPNFYFHRLYQKVTQKNQAGLAVTSKDPEYRELSELDWGENKHIFERLEKGQTLNEEEQTLFIKAKFHTAREVEHYQHDVLNRMIQKGVTLISLPSSNNKLTGQFEDYKDHPFSWWEKKGVQLGVGTDNFVTLNTNYIQEMLILLFTDSENLKITKLLMVTTGESRRPYISHLLWSMRKKIQV